MGGVNLDEEEFVTVKELREKLSTYNDSDLIAVTKHSDYTDEVNLSVQILVQRMSYLERYYPNQYKVGSQPKPVQCLVID